jgi:MoaA/NifB/PqqE/SkfB family radical SAM enzyme
MSVMMARRPSATLDAPPELALHGNLASVDIYVTSQCNRRCSYCFLPAEYFSSGLRMGMDAFTGIVTWSERHGVREVTLLGGEASLHPAFVDMVNLAAAHELAVRVVTNGARRFRRLLSTGMLGARSLTRVAVSLDTLDAAVQDALRGPGAWQDAIETISLLRSLGVPFDINVTAVRSVLDGIHGLIDFAEERGCRRLNIHWPSDIGLGASLPAGEIPRPGEWADLVRTVGLRTEKGSDFFVEVERGFLAEGELLAGCALTDVSNLQVLPDGRAYRCGLLVDQAGMSSLTMTGDQLLVTGQRRGEELLRAAMPAACERCPVGNADARRACIYDKVSSAQQ